jgi:LPXTG-site transpeptidase (sortase) family protein
MSGIISAIARLIRVGKRIQARKWSFLVLFAVAYMSSGAVLAELDLLPEAKSAPAAAVVATNDAQTTLAVETAVPEVPTKIEIPAINLAASIANPSTTNIEALDRELLRGAVRYPTSAKLGEAGNVVLFGHSSYLPVVKNQAYKTFNGIQKLAVGDVITVFSSGTAYTYKVKTVSKESAKDAVIPLAVVGKVLTLSTCDSFGAATDRFVVVADFVESHSITT